MKAGSAALLVLCTQARGRARKAGARYVCLVQLRDAAAPSTLGGGGDAALHEKSRQEVLAMEELAKAKAARHF